MSVSEQGRFSREFLAQEVERTFNEYSFAWEGEIEEVHDEGDLLVRVLPNKVYGWDALVMRPNLAEDAADARIDAVLEALQPARRSIWWMFGDTVRPADLGDRLVARGFRRVITWDGLALTDLSVAFPVNPAVVVEPFSLDNLQEVVAAYEPDDPVARQVRVEAGERYFALPRPESLTLIGRLDGVVASVVVLRLDPTGIAYLRNAFTLPAYRGRGVYLTMIEARLKIAREAGCTAAVVQAQVQSSSPILRKRGFERVCGFYGYTTPVPASA
jgi:GNAT superfamily N-acetyltransferase